MFCGQDSPLATNLPFFWVIFTLGYKVAFWGQDSPYKDSPHDIAFLAEMGSKLHFEV